MMDCKQCSCSQFTRRNFLISTARLTIGSLFFPYLSWAEHLMEEEMIRPCGPASTYRSKLVAAFLRREGEYGMWWPGQIYDGEAALQTYQRQILATAEGLNMELDLLQTPLYSAEAADQWLSASQKKQPDGLLLVLLDRQQHAWPTVARAAETAIPTIVFSPLGTSFTTNTAEPSKKEGVYICSTDNFRQVAGAIKMIDAGSKIRESKFLVIKGQQRISSQIPHMGTKLQYIPAENFISEYRSIKNSTFLDKLVKDLSQQATAINGSSQQDIINGIKSYLVAKNLLEREKCDGITMDCLGTLKDTDISLPCIAWSKMNDHQIPAACEADLGACVTHALVQHLFDRPGFQQDPVAETMHDCLIGSHCSCPTKLNGFTNPAEAYDIVPHHANRDATARTVWRVGQRITIADLILAEKKEAIQMIISAGEVVDNRSIPPSGGCVIAPMVKLDNVSDTLDYPGFHQIFFYGDHKKALKGFCQLYGIKPVVV
jgi:hypothetical protein